MKKLPTRCLEQGFTLIELLVVIAIVSLLAAILFPVFGRARENARRSSCASNLKQVGLGVMQYTQDYDETFPVGDSSSGNRGNGWGGQVYPYIKSAQVFTCPSDMYKAPGQNFTISYAMNQSIVWAAANCTATANISGFSAPVLTVMFFEVTNCQWFPRDDAPKPTGVYSWISSPTGNGGANTANLTSPQSVNRAYATGYFHGIGEGATPFTEEPRHLSGSNYLFADGHVKWLRAESVSPGLAAPSPSSAAYPTGGCYNAAGTAVLGGLAATFSPR